MLRAVVSPRARKGPSFACLVLNVALIRRAISVIGRIVSKASILYTSSYLAN